MLLRGTGEPDVLEVISDLSNDEVFTPPRVVNAVLDLLPEHVWFDPDLRWLDPGSKTGVFLREAARRLMNGLEAVLPNEDERLEHILRNMVFGVAITELTSLMSRRTLYCSKDASEPLSAIAFPSASGNIWFDHVEHTYQNGRCTQCSASEERMEGAGRDNHAYAFIHEAGREGIDQEFEMQFDVIIGNPPYHMTGGGGGSNDTPLYNLFVEEAKALGPRYISMVIPSRWMAGGRGLSEFRAEMLKDRRLRTLVDYPKASDLFPPGVQIKGGVCYFLWDKDHDGACEVTLVRDSEMGGPYQRDLGEFDVFVRDATALSILRKVVAFEESSLEDLVSGDTPFGLATNFRDHRDSNAPGEGELLLHRIEGGHRTVAVVARDQVKKNAHLMDCWKVLVPKAYGAGEDVPHQILGATIVASPASVCTQTYLVVGPLSSSEEAGSAKSYLDTKLARFLVSLRKITQDAMRGVYRWVPQQSWDREWTDKELYKKYAITEEEQAYIADMIREMPT